MKITFVVLHYETISDTRECIKSLEQYGEDDIQIVVVDNGSVIGKNDALEKEYAGFSNIHFLKSTKNLGFAKGNNLGFCFAKYRLHSDIIILANNDLVFSDTGFVKKLERCYRETNFDIAGPKIISLVDHKNQNPVPIIYPKTSSIVQRTIKFFVLYILSFIGCDKKLKDQVGSGIDEYRDYEHEDYQLHGACMIFGKRYIDKFDGLYPKTFMYGEESILKHFADSNNMSMLYIDDIQVYHKEGSSTGSVYKKDVKRRRFFYKWNMHSCLLLLWLTITRARKY